MGGPTFYTTSALAPVAFAVVVATALLLALVPCANIRMRGSRVTLLVIALGYVGFVVWSVIMWNVAFTDVEEDVGTVRERLASLRAKIDGDCGCLGLDTASLFSGPVYHLVVVGIDQLHYFRPLVFVAVLSIACFTAPLVVGGTLLKQRSTYLARIPAPTLEMVGLTLLALTVTSLIVAAILNDIFDSAYTALEDANSTDMRIITGKQGCQAPKASLLAVNDDGCMWPDYTNTTGCVYSASVILASIAPAVGHPGAAVLPIINVSVPLNSTGDYPSCIIPCFEPTSGTDYSLEDRICRLKDATVHLLGADFTRYTRSTHILIYGAVGATSVFLLGAAWLAAQQQYDSGGYSPSERSNSMKLLHPSEW